MSQGKVTECAFLKDNGNIVAVVEEKLPPLSSGYYQLKANPRFYEIHAGSQVVARFDMPHPDLFEHLTHMSQIAVMECADGVWPDIITNTMYVQTSMGASI